MHVQMPMHLWRVLIIISPAVLVLTGSKRRRKNEDMDMDDVLLNAPMFFPPLEGNEAKDAVLFNKDLLLRIFKNLDFEYVARSALVCEAWHAVAQSKEFWSSVNMEGRPVTLEQVRDSLGSVSWISHVTSSTYPFHILSLDCVELHLPQKNE